MNNKDKIVAFAGHRYEWHCIGVENKLPNVLEDLIAKGYTIFYDGGIKMCQCCYGIKT